MSALTIENHLTKNIFSEVAKWLTLNEIRNFFSTSIWARNLTKNQPISNFAVDQKVQLLWDLREDLIDTNYVKQLNTDNYKIKDLKKIENPTVQQLLFLDQAFIINSIQTNSITTDSSDLPLQVTKPSGELCIHTNETVNNLRQYLLAQNTFKLWGHIAEQEALSTDLIIQNHPREDFKKFTNVIIQYPLWMQENQNKVQEILTFSFEKRRITQIDPIGDLSAVNELLLSRNQIEDVAPLGNCKQLTKLVMYQNHILNARPLDSCTNLTELNLSNNFLSDISFLKTLVNLTDLSLAYNRIVIADPLTSLAKLRTLSLNGNQIVEFPDMSQSDSLTNLYINDNRLTSAASIGKITSLGLLHLENNEIHTGTFLPIATKLTMVNLKGNQIDITEFKKLNPSCTVITAQIPEETK